MAGLTLKAPPGDKEKGGEPSPPPLDHPLVGSYLYRLLISPQLLSSTATGSSQQFALPNMISSPGNSVSVTRSTQPSLVVPAGATQGEFVSGKGGRDRTDEVDGQHVHVRLPARTVNKCTSAVRHGQFNAPQAWTTYREVGHRTHALLGTGNITSETFIPHDGFQIAVGGKYIRIIQVWRESQNNIGCEELESHWAIRKIQRRVEEVFVLFIPF